MSIGLCMRRRMYEIQIILRHDVLNVHPLSIYEGLPS